MITKNQIWKLYGTQYKEMTKELLFKTELADLIAERLSGKLVMPSDTDSLQQACPEHDKAFDIAMDFINSL